MALTIPTLTPLTRKLSLYSDFHKDMTQNPISDDLALKLDENAVKESLKNLVLTDKGERPFQPELGGNVRAYLFDLMTPDVIKMIEEEVRTVINNHEPRVSLINVDVTGLSDENTVSVDIYFYLRNSETPLSTTVFLERTR